MGRPVRGFGAMDVQGSLSHLSSGLADGVLGKPTEPVWSGLPGVPQASPAHGEIGVPYRDPAIGNPGSPVTKESLGVTSAETRAGIGWQPRAKILREQRPAREYTPEIPEEQFGGLGGTNPPIGAILAE